MTGAASLAFPGSRTLALWRRALGTRDVAAWWVGYLFVHRIEAMTESLTPRSLDPLQTLLLQAIGMERSRESEDELCLRLQERLHLGVPIIRTLLGGLASLGLIASPGKNGDNDRTRRPDSEPVDPAPHRMGIPSPRFWELTAQGQSALREGRVLEGRRLRRAFAFVERVSAGGVRAAPPHLLPLAESSAAPWHVDADYHFAFDDLAQCTSRDPGWRQTFGLPADLHAFPAPPATTEAALSDWESIVLDRGERLCVLLMIEGERLVGFAVRQEGWVLSERTPILSMPATARSILPDLASDPPMEAWRQAWLGWCQTRAVPPMEAEACRLTFEVERLRIEAPPRLVERLEAGKSDILKGDAWILAGEGYLRRAARMELVRLE